jgi:hypothetical protein
MAVKQDGFVVSVARLILLGSNALVNVGKGKGSSLGGKHFRAPFVGSIKVGGGGGGSPDCDFATNCCRRLEQYPTEGQALPLTLEARLIGNEGWPDVDAL